MEQIKINYDIERLPENAHCEFGSWKLDIVNGEVQGEGMIIAILHAIQNNILEQVLDEMEKNKIHLRPMKNACIYKLQVDRSAIIKLSEIIDHSDPTKPLGWHNDYKMYWSCHGDYYKKVSERFIELITRCENKKQFYDEMRVGGKSFESIESFMIYLMDVFYTLTRDGPLKIRDVETWDELSLVCKQRNIC